MKTLLSAATVLMLGIANANAQEAAPAPAPAPQATPTCAEALPQIESLVGQAEQAGIETTNAKGHVETASAAQASGDEGGCIDALILAQNDVLTRAQAAGATGSQTPAEPTE